MKQKIMDAAAELFSEHGYHKTSIDEIAEAAGVAKGSVYYHFQNKSQLFCETILQGIQYFEEQILQIKDSYAPGPVIAEQIIDLMADIFMQHRTLSDMVMMHVTDGLDAEVAEKIQNAREHMIDTIANVIETGVQTRDIKRCHASAIAQGMVHFVYSYCRHAEPVNQAEAKKEIAHVLLNGILH